MDEEKFKLHLEQTTYDLHLFGGLRAGTAREGCLFVSSSVKSGRGVQFAEVKDTHKYRTSLLPYGLDIVGWEVLTAHQSVWHIMAPKLNVDAIRDWAWIVNRADEVGDREGAELARNVAFSLRAASERLRDISRAYGAQLEYVTATGTEIGARYANVESFTIYLELHAFLTEAATARDHLAAFIAQRILSGPEFSTVRRMSKLAEVLRKVGPNGALANYILAACDKDHVDGWMAQLGRYRNKIIHDAPISVMAQSDYLEVRATNIGALTLPRIYLGMPTNPFLPEAAFADALEHFRSLMLRLLEFAAMVVAVSPIPPTPVTLTEADMR